MSGQKVSKQFSTSHKYEAIVLVCSKWIVSTFSDMPAC